MEFWGQEVKPGATVSCKVDDDLVIHLSQVALGESKKANENAIVSVKIDDKKLVLGTLSVEKHPQISCDLVFDKDFEISHNSKTATVFFCGYKSPVPQYEPDFGEDSSDEELETDQIPTRNNEIKISEAAAKVPVKGEKIESSSDDDDEDFTGSESDDSEMSDEDDSSDEDDMSDSSDDSASEEETPAPKKTDVVVGKKRAIEAEVPSAKKAKSEQSAQKTDDHLEVMAPPKWPKEVMDCFVDECYRMVMSGCGPINKSVFFNRLEKFMQLKSKEPRFDGIPLLKDDLLQQFKRLDYLWGEFHHTLQDWTMRHEMEKVDKYDPSLFMGYKKISIYDDKFTNILRYETKLNTIFSKYHLAKEKSLGAYEFNCQSSGRYNEDNSVTSRRRSIDEPFSRQVRQKSSDFDMPEPSKNGMAFDSAEYERAIQELHDGGVDDFTYAIACEFLKDPQALSGYSRLSDLKRKVNHLKISWKVKHDPMSVIGNLPPIN